MELIELLIFIAILAIFYFLGYQTKLYFERKKLIDVDGLGTVESSLLALFAFFLGFTFSISASKIEQVRQSSVKETNAIGTALLRCDLYDQTTQSELETLFKSYIGKRLEEFKSFNDNENNPSEATSLTSADLGNEIWNYVIDKYKSGDYESQSRLMIPAINDMLDSSTSRDSDIRASLPPVIIGTLYFLSICSCFIVGFSQKGKAFSNVIGFIYLLIVALTVYLIIDAGDPTKGMVNIDRTNHNIELLYEQLKP